MRLVRPITEGSDEGQSVRVWPAERTVSDDEQNVVSVYVTPDDERYFWRERALTSGDDHRETTAAVEVPPHSPGRTEDPETRERYVAEARRMAETHTPDDTG